MRPQPAQSTVHWNRLFLLLTLLVFVAALLYVLFVATLDDTTKTLWGFLFGGLTLVAAAAVV